MNSKRRHFTLQFLLLATLCVPALGEKPPPPLRTEDVVERYGQEIAQDLSREPAIIPEEPIVEEVPEGSTGVPRDELSDVLDEVEGVIQQTKHQRARRIANPSPAMPASTNWSHDLNAAEGRPQAASSPLAEVPLLKPRRVQGRAMLPDRPRGQNARHYSVGATSGSHSSSIE